jgi:hypothetical protein
VIDLWPENLGSASGKAPVAILKEQAAWLEKKTNNVIVGRIDQSYLPRIAVLEKYGTDEDLFMYDFYLEVPLLDHFHYNLLTIFHGIDLYPLIINVEDAIKNEISINNINIIANTKDIFLTILKKIFTSKRTLAIINAILTQVNEIGPACV